MSIVKTKRFTMEKLAIIKFLVPLVLACLYNGTRISAESLFQLLSRVGQDGHWKDMWFDQFGGEVNWNPKSKLWCTEINLETVARLRLVPPMMGCAYGVQLNHYLLLAVEAINLCNEMRRTANGNAADCKTKVRQSLEKGKTVILKLVHTLEYMYFRTADNVDKDQFYIILSSLKDFTKGRIHIELSGLVLGGLTINRLFNSVAVTLGHFLLHNCKPDYRVFDKTVLSDGYNGDPNGIYSYYVEKLDSYTDYIAGHLNGLGFQYNAVAGHLVTF